MTGLNGNSLTKLPGGNRDKRHTEGDVEKVGVGVLGGVPPAARRRPRLLSKELEI
jgi:hypothetical protein